MATSKTTGSLETANAETKTYKVGYTYAADNGQLRSSSIIIDANSETAAKEFAKELIKEAKHGKVTTVKLY